MNETIVGSRGRCRTLARRLTAWFEDNGRHFPWRNRSATRYQQVVSEILLRRTRAETVARIYPIFFRKFPSWKALASSRRTTIEKVVKPLGLHRRRAESLYLFARYAASINMRFPRDRSALEAIPAVGLYVASAILLFCHDQPEPLLDVNMARVLERYFGFARTGDIRHDSFLQELATRFVKEADDPRRLNWAVLDLGGTICTARNPSCSVCPLRRGCRSMATIDNQAKAALTGG